ncbi:MAG: VanZ family protein [Pontibacterium sp.]
MQHTKANLFTALYTALLIFLITQNPFDYHWKSFAPWEIKSYFSLRDGAQNILLFLPLGIALGLSKHVSLIKLVTFSALFSLSIETLQFYNSRHSDIYDVMTNTLGGLSGGIAGILIIKSIRHLRHSHHALSTLCLGILLIPFYWVIAMRSASEPVVLAYAIGLLALPLAQVFSLQYGASTIPKVAVLASSAMALLPVIYINPVYAAISIFSLGCLWHSRLRLALTTHRVTHLIIYLAIAASLAINLGSYLLANNWGWSVATHLRWIELIGLAGLALYHRFFILPSLKHFNATKYFSSS